MIRAIGFDSLLSVTTTFCAEAFTSQTDPHQRPSLSWIREPNVLWSKPMATLTESKIVKGACSYATFDVLASVYRLKVSRVNAAAQAAEMIDLIGRCDRSDEPSIGDTVSADPTKDAVALRITTRAPNPTALFVDFYF